MGDAEAGGRDGMRMSKVPRLTGDPFKMVGAATLSICVLEDLPGSRDVLLSRVDLGGKCREEN